MGIEVCGIDYGSKLAGTTSISYLSNGQVQLIRSEKKRDADELIVSFCEEFEPRIIALDAPLSLPGVYTGQSGCNDFFYRASDREVRAMSPMFLGGLTARAMKLSNRITASGFIEAYPAKRASVLDLSKYNYKKKEPDYPSILQKMGFSLKDEIRSSHDFDSILCLEIGGRYLRGEAQSVGSIKEGLIYY